MASVISARTIALPLADVRALFGSLRGDGPVLLGLAALGLVSHGLNMFQYPSYTGIDDEGIYAAQAWAVLHQGQLSPYTYVYDHVPGGWLLVAAWMALTGGPHAFGGAIDSGRALMLLLHVASLLMLFRISRKLGCSTAMSALAAFLFTVSPLGLGYQRRLLLDNLMLFWGLLSLDLLLDGWGRLSRVTLSGVCFGIALLTKETAIFLLPPMLYIAWQQRWQHQARFAVFGWLVPAAVVVSWYPLYAALKGELLPASASVQFSTSGYGNAGVSLIESLLWQIGRDGGGAFNLNNQFWSLVRSDWAPKDRVLLVGGVLAMLINVARGWRGTAVGNRRALATGLLALLPMAYLARGGIVFDFYVVAVIPFLCLNLAVLFAPLLDRLPNAGQVVAVVAVAALLLGGYVRTGVFLPLYTQAPSTAGREAITWIKTHVASDASIIVRDDLWTDLREAGSGRPGFPNVHSYTKVAGDPAIRGGVFGDDWRRVDFLVTAPGLDRILADSGNTIAQQALQHAHPVKTWTADGTTLELWKVDKAASSEKQLLQASAAYLQQRFDRGGALTAPDGSVTSESQAYALLRAAWSGERDSFDRTWRWTKAHLLNSNRLLAWKWKGEVLDNHSAADADTDAALALLMAGRRWANAEWLADGKRIVTAIWSREVARAGEGIYVTAGDWAPTLQVLPVNPSYFAPYAYHAFQEVDPDHDWLGIIDAGYQLLFESSAAALGAGRSAGLPADWLGIERGSGRVQPLQAGSDANTSAYSFDAPRTYWRVALDLRWHGDGRAEAYLAQAGFLRDEVNRSGFVRAVYSHDGSVGSAEPSVVGTAGALAALLTLDRDAANRLYAGQILGGVEYAADSAHWADPSDLYAQEWGWFATGLYANALTNIWHGEWQESEV